MKLSDHVCDPAIPNPNPQWIGYQRLYFEFTGEFEHDEPVMEPVFRSGEARLVEPIPGAVVRGVLVDCPEGEGTGGCVVVDTGAEFVAVQSTALANLVIEHAPCCLEFIATPLQDYNHRLWWDWEAYELSPNGPRVLVSDEHEEFRIAPACEWLREMRESILPALQIEIDGLESRERRLLQERDESLLLQESSSPDLVRGVVEGELFGSSFRAAKVIVQRANGTNPHSIAETPTLSTAFRLLAARALLTEYERHRENSRIQLAIDRRVHEVSCRQVKRRELVRSLRATRSMLVSLVESAGALADKLEGLSTQMVCMRRSTRAATRHLSPPEKPRRIPTPIPGSINMIPRP